MSLLPDGGRAGRVLVVEDDLLIRSLTVEWVESAGYRAVDVGSAAEAMEEMQQGADRFEIAILDVGLPDVQGAELSGQLRAVDPGLKVLFATGNAYALDADAVEPPRTGVLQKPYSRSELAAALLALDGDAHL